VASSRTRPSDVDACPGECNRAWVAAERAAFDEMAWVKVKRIRPDFSVLNHGVPMVPAAPVWCRECQTSITQTIAGFPDLCATLTPGELNTGRDVQVGPRVAAIVPPTNSPAWDQADEIIRWAVNTEDTLRARIGDLGRGPRPWRTLSSAVWYLTAHATPLLCSPDAVAIGFDALRMSRRAGSGHRHRQTHPPAPWGMPGVRPQKPATIRRQRPGEVLGVWGVMGLRVLPVPCQGSR